MSSFSLVVERELRESLRRKVIWVVASVLFLGGTALVVLPEVVGGDPADRTVLIVGEQTSDVTEAIDRAADQFGLTVSIERADNAATARAAVEADDADVAVVLARQPVVVIAASADSDTVTMVRQAVSGAALAASLAEAGLSPSEVSGVFESGATQVDELDPVDTSRRGVAAVITTVLYLLLVLLTSAVAGGVAIEKSNRVSEVLLAIVPARDLFFGKIVGVALVGLFTLVCGALPVLIKSALGGSLPDGTLSTVLGGAVWFVLGVALFLVTAGALGALVDRQEEVGSTVAPLSAILIAAYLVGISAPESAVATVLAYIPFTSPMVMPARIALGVASPVELVVSLVIGIATVAVVARLATQIYQRAIVRTGSKVALRTVIKSHH